MPRTGRGTNRKRVGESGLTEKFDPLPPLAIPQSVDGKPIWGIILVVDLVVDLVLDVALNLEDEEDDENEDEQTVWNFRTRFQTTRLHPRAEPRPAGPAKLKANISSANQRRIRA